MGRGHTLAFILCLISAEFAFAASPQDGSAYVFSRIRAEYRLDLTAEGTLVIDRASGTETLVPYGERMIFAGCPKYSKDTIFIIHHVRTHAETYRDWGEIADLPVDFLRTGPYFTWNGQTPRECMREVFSSPARFPDRPDKAIVAYINSSEYTRIGEWDPSFDPAWDTDGDAVIDRGAGPLPDYVDPKVFNASWKSYVARYWTDSWREELAKKIDLVAAENFDGLLLDVMTCYWTWKSAYPSMDLDQLRQRYVDLIEWVSGYAKSRYGSAFLVTANIDLNACEYFPDLGGYVDGGYYQNAFFRWDGSAVIDGPGLSTSQREYRNEAIDFLRDQGLSILDMDHLGTGSVSPGLDFENYNDRITDENLLKIFRWAIDSGSTPFVTPVFMGWRYGMLPRFTRVYPDLPPATDTPYRDWVLGSPSDDCITTGRGDDLVYGGAGNDRIDGGEGEDAVLYTGPRRDYVVSKAGETAVVTAQRGDEGTDILTGIERLIFSDKTEDVP